MRLHRFFIHEFIEGTLAGIQDGKVCISNKDLIHQWKDVFRLKSGKSLILLDNTGNEYLATISELHKEGASLRITEASTSKNIPRHNMTLYCSLIKKDNFEWILGKGTEIGVSTFVPVLSDRSEKKDLNFERAKKIIKESSEQSGRGILPELKEIINLNEAVNDTHLKLFAFDPTGEIVDLEKIKGNDVGIFIGPEGGWTEKELEQFSEREIEIYSLGTQVLRAETAAVSIAALTLF